MVFATVCVLIWYMIKISTFLWDKQLDKATGQAHLSLLLLSLILSLSSGILNTEPNQWLLKPYTGAGQNEQRLLQALAR